MKFLRAGLTIILLVYSVPTVLSGLDIFKADEPDLSSEWIVVLIFFVLTMVLILVNFLGILKRDK